MDFQQNKITLENNGFSITDKLFSNFELEKIKAFFKDTNLFAIRQLFNVYPKLTKLLFTNNLISLINTIGGKDYFLTKAIYFNKPKEANWFVGYHQDLSISVNKKVKLENYKNWTFKNEQFGVQPPINILEKTITLRIHLDDTNIENGALKVIPKSHKKGILLDHNTEQEKICFVKKGCLMLMKPLTLHASNRTTNNKQRRVIHLEFCNQELRKPLKWLERI